MATQFEKDFQKAYNFYQQHKAEINEIFKKNKLFNIEFDSAELSRLFDLYAGIDYVVCQSSQRKLFGIASRINFNPNHHKHVTIRYKRKSGAPTEYQKRVSSILNKSGEIYATITMQIDAIQDKENPNKQKILRAIVFESDKLYMAIHKNLEFFEKTFMIENHQDGNLFFKIPSSAIEEMGKREGFSVKIVKFE